MRAHTHHTITNTISSRRFRHFHHLHARFPVVIRRLSRAKQRGVSGAELDAMRNLFDEFDQDGNGTICFDEFTEAMQRLNVQPQFMEEEEVLMEVFMAVLIMVSIMVGMSQYYLVPTMIFLFLRATENNNSLL